jgi:Mrp family chromosome partitioning ATPase
MGELYQVLLEDPGALGLLARQFFDDTALEMAPSPPGCEPFVWPQEKVVVPATGDLEGARALRTRLLQHPLRPRVVMVASSGPGEGKSATARSLAVAAALVQGFRVLLVTVSSGGSPGLLDVLAGDVRLAEALRQAEGLENLCVLPGGEPRREGEDLLHTDRWDALCRQVRMVFDLVVVDGPVWRGSAGDQVLRASADGVLLACCIDRTRRDALAGALEQLEGPRFLGVILTR